MRHYFTRRCIGLHITILILLPTFAWLTWWQLTRALGGNALSWAYTFEWPLFAFYGTYVWWQLIHDQPTAVTRLARTGQGVDRGVGWALDGSPGPGAGASPLDGPGEGAAAAGAVGAVGAVGAAGFGAADAPGGRSREVRRHRDRLADQTPEEAAALEDYNRYLAGLQAADEAAAAAGRRR